MEFLREPRRTVPPMACGDVAVDPPPPVPKLLPANPLSRLLPIAMLVACVGMMAVYFTSGATTMRNPMFMFFPVMMLTSVLGTLVSGARGANRTAEVNRDRQRYLCYLDGLDAVLATATDAQRSSTRFRHPEPSSLWTLVGGPRMWERGPDDPDFCLIRIGCGDTVPSTTLVPPELGADEEPDPVTVSALHRLLHVRSSVPDVPITLALRESRLLTVDGDPQAARSLLRAIVCQLAVLHGPDHVAIAAVADADTRAEWDWLKWLPHHQHPRRGDGAGAMRLAYRNLGDATAEAGDDGRHLLIVMDGGTPFGPLPAAGVTVLAVGMDHDASRADERRVLHVCAGWVRTVGETEQVGAQADALTRTQAEVCARRLAPYRIAAPAPGRGARSPAPGWLALMGIDDLVGLDPDQRWASSVGGHVRPAPIGVSESGACVELDINEAARGGMGPHGLCVGATGSGKSELLRTLVLGLITANSPDALNLILVDFKGGATFLGMERARHTAAVITNLADESHLVSRMHDALTGEMMRRQELLRSVGNFANVGEYARARSTGAPLPPLPALFIVVDEFSELLSQHPEFAELFVTIGRLGRSLGMHLLLASQRLDESRLRGLETHLAYRICLKTFSVSESRAVLGMPDASHLPSAPGAAYLKTASGDLVRFQTAFVSGPSRRSERPAVAPTRPVRPAVFTAATVGQVRDDAVAAATAANDAGAPTLLHTVLDRVSGHGTPAHRVWLPPLSDPPTLDMLPHDGCPRGAAAIGLVDNPLEQRHDLLVADLFGASGSVAVVGATRSGKSTAVRTLILALAQRHDPTEVGFYCLDFGGGALASLKQLGHVGAVAGRGDVDLCRRTVAVVESVISAREARFRRLGIDSMADYRRMRAAGDPATAEDPYGDVFLVVDGWSTLRQEFENLEPAVTAIAARGLSFGVHVVVTASRWAELRPALKDQLATRIELRLGDAVDSEMNRHRARLLSGRPAGRGITAEGREMVVALPRWDGRRTADGLTAAIAETVARLTDRCDGARTPPVKLLPNRVEYRDVISRATGRNLRSQPLIGIDERELEPVTVDFDGHPHLLILGEPGCGKTAVLRLLCRELTRVKGPDEARLELVDFRRSLLGVVESEHLGGYVMSPAGLASRLRAVVGDLQSRMPDECVTQQQLRTRSWWSGPEVYLVVDDYDLAAAAAGNPLASLADLLPHASDLGLHVIVARRSGGAARAMFDPVLARLRELGSAGLMMSASADDGVLLGTVRPSPLPPGRATLVSRGQADQLVQVAWTDPP
ncbi:type VII secretion protein EccCa [Mycolicibacterium sp. XJ1819]